MRSIRAPGDGASRGAADLTDRGILQGAPSPMSAGVHRPRWQLSERPPKCNVTLEWRRGFAEGLLHAKTPQGWRFSIPAGYLVADLFDMALTQQEGRYRDPQSPRSAAQFRSGYWRWHQR